MADSDSRQVRLRWAGEGLKFEGGPDGGFQMGVDSAGETGQSPMELLLMAVAGCMAIDVVLILQKSRVPLTGLEVNAVGVRAEEMPKRYVSVRLEYLVTGPGVDDMTKVDRSIELSRDKYCSVLHTLDPELDFDVSVQRG